VERDCVLHQPERPELVVQKKKGENPEVLQHMGLPPKKKQRRVELDLD
jgi:hypothetical protein